MSKTKTPARSWVGKSHMPLRRRSRGRKLTAVTVLLFAACCACIALLARINRSRSASPPQFSSVCGHWQQKYARLHRQTLAGRRSKRLCIATTRDEQGLYDRLTGDRPLPGGRSMCHALVPCGHPPLSPRSCQRSLLPDT